MKKKKSVTQLNVKDVINKDSSRYLLQHQEQDSQGEMVTELYKVQFLTYFVSLAVFILFLNELLNFDKFCIFTNL